LTDIRLLEVLFVVLLSSPERVLPVEATELPETDTWLEMQPETNYKNCGLSRFTSDLKAVVIFVPWNIPQPLLSKSITTHYSQFYQILFDAL